MMAFMEQFDGLVDGAGGWGLGCVRICGSDLGPVLRSTWQLAPLSRGLGALECSCLVSTGSLGSRWALGFSATSLTPL